ncbi:MAG: dipeptide/oligopeptide/nickel ABC transporter ATP-binding protein [Spirochaetes bacterium]|nr:MAG: dipeptide/oligopeptide/nickel ABC transporter ATP-binding protein [Spirochaetota bacterium]
MEKLIETEDLYTNFFTFEGVVRALNGVSVVVNQGETYGLVGESGCGKSVTVRSMMRIVQEPGKIVGGKILLFLSSEDRQKGIDIIKRSEAFMESIRGDDISMIFQEASTSLNPVLSIRDQVGESFLLHRRGELLEETLKQLADELKSNGFPLAMAWKGFQRWLFRRELESLRRYEKHVKEIDRELYELEEKTDPRSTRRKSSLNARRDRLSEHDFLVSAVKKSPFLERYYKKIHKIVENKIIELLKSLGVPNPANVLKSYPHELSGGMQQRIVIAIALACNPTLLIADEPTSNLDVTIQAQIIELIKMLKENIITSVLFITHDLGLVAEVCERVTVMYAGDTCETTSVKELFKNPLHPYTKGLLSSVPRIEQVEKLHTIPGTVPNLINPPAGCRFHPRCPSAMKICAERKPPMVEYKEGHTVSCHLYPGEEV